MYDCLNQKQKIWVDSLLDSMSDNELIGQMVNEHASKLLRYRSNPAAYLKKYPVGSLFCGTEVIDKTADIADAMRPISSVVKKANIRVPVLYSGDFESGIGANIDGFTKMTRLQGLAATFSRENAYNYGKVIGTEGVTLNIHWAFGPVADLNTNKENPPTNVRSTGDNPDHSLMILKSVVEGMQDSGCAACAKHFPGDGTDSRNQHYVTSLNLLSKEDWNRLHGRIFRELIASGVMSIMVGHLGFPACEDRDPLKKAFRPATCSKRLITGLLRDELNFQGIVVTDAVGMAGYDCWGTYEERIIDGINAGVDVFLWPQSDKFFPLVHAALLDGRIKRSTLETAARRVLSFKALLNLNQTSVRQSNCEIMKIKKDNALIAAKIAEESITLLRNDKNVLPLSLRKNAKILVLIDPDTPETRQNLAPFINGLIKRGYDVLEAPFDHYLTLHKLIGTFDAVFLLGNHLSMFGHRPFNAMYWPFRESPEMKNGIVISFGSPYMIYEIDGFPTYINTYSDTGEVVAAALKAVFGELPIKGRSPVSLRYCFKHGDGIITH